MFVYLCLPLRRSAVQSWENCKQQLVIRVQRKSVLQLAIRASFSLLVLYRQKSFQSATTFLVLPTKTVTWAVIRLFFFSLFGTSCHFSFPLLTREQACFLTANDNSANGFFQEITTVFMTNTRKQ